MTWYWYAARDNEIFLDLDSKPRAAYAFMRLRRAIRQEALQVKNVYLYRTSPGKFHMIIVLLRGGSEIRSFTLGAVAPMGAARRARWAMYLGSDVVRGLYTEERITRGLDWPDLLISKHEYYRAPDALCACPEKHKPKRITQNCPIMRAHHGDEAGAVYFAKNHDRKKRDRFRIPVGREISIAQIARL